MNEIKFRKTSEYYGCFSNFSRHPVEFEGKIYPTSEHLYQSRKFTDDYIREKIRLAPTPKLAANIGRESEGLRQDWDDAKVIIMKRIIRMKMEQNPEVKRKLLESGESELIEDAPWDSYWGNGADGKGLNMLGKLWMDLRDSIKSQSKNSNITE